MKEDQNNFKQALLDVRKSQRLLVGFYQRILPVIESISTSLNCKFHYWAPSNNLKPPQGNGNPLERWGWDFSPLNDAIFLFVNQDAKRNVANDDEWSLVIRLQTDSGIIESFDLEKKDWDAFHLAHSPEESETSLELIAYKPTKNVIENWAWWNIYAETDFPPSTGEVIDGYQDVKAFCFSINVEDVLEEADLQKNISLFKEKLELNGFIDKHSKTSFLE